MADPLWPQLVPIAGVLAGYGLVRRWPARLPRFTRALAALALALVADGLSRIGLALARAIA